jgi:hypothetical protein
MAALTINGSALGSTLQNLLMCDEITPGAEPSYQLCKEIYLYHPLGSKIVDTPIQMAQSQQRIITITDSPGTRVRDAFVDQWKAMDCDKTVANHMRVARIYGVGTIVLGEVGKLSAEAIPPDRLGQANVFFNVIDPLNSAGSIGYDQDPNSPTYQKPTAVIVQGQVYHPSRALVTFNEAPIYIAWSSSAFGYTGRSVFQRSLFPLRSFVQSMITDDLVTKKAGVIVAKMKAVASMTDGFVQAVFGLKRDIVKEAQTTNVINIDVDESIETLDMQNVDKASTTARRNILENIASSTPMPAIILNSQTFAEGFGEGTEDAKTVAQFIDGVRADMAPAYAFLDNVVQRKAWTEDFFKTIQDDFPAEYGKMKYKDAYWQWVNSFQAEWPSLLTEPDSKKVEVEDVKLKGVIALLEVLLPNLDPRNKARTIQWANETIGENKLMFPTPLLLDYDDLSDFIGEQATSAEAVAEAAAAAQSEEADNDKEPAKPKPFAAAA